MSVTYTQEQLDIALLKNDQSTISKTLDRIESRLNSLEQKVDSHYHWMIGCIIGLYGLAITGLIAAIGKAYGVL